MAYGTNQLLDTLRVLDATTVNNFGEQRIFDEITRVLQIHNEQMRDMIAPLVEFSDQRLRRYGGVDQTKMEPADEYSAPLAQKVSVTPQNIGFPLRMYQYGVQFTLDYILTRTVAELASQIEAALDADVRNLTLQIKKALYEPTNYTFDDYRVDNLQLPVKKLANADSFYIPVGPNGETFNSATHTHYLATASLTNQNLVDAINTVAEHDTRGALMLYISRTDETAVKALASFKPYTDARLVQPITLVSSGGSLAGSVAVNAVGNINIANTGNRAIGLFEQAEVWVKPWVPAGYLTVVRLGLRQPLLFRTRTGSALGQLRLAAEYEQYPLRAQFMTREFGVSVQERVSAAILYTGGGSYTAPTLT